MKRKIIDVEVDRLVEWLCGCQLKFNDEKHEDFLSSKKYAKRQRKLKCKILKTVQSSEDIGTKFIECGRAT